MLQPDCCLPSLFRLLPRRVMSDRAASVAVPPSDTALQATRRPSVRPSASLRPAPIT